MTRPPTSSGTELSIRMLASVLVDADRIDAGNLPSMERVLEDPGDRLERLLNSLARRAATVSSQPVREARRDVLSCCLEAGRGTDRILSLSVPTGGGKTLASIAFALQRAALRPADVRRIIYVVPYLSIIEQNARVIGEAIGEDLVLEHHSGELLDEAVDREGAPQRAGIDRDAWLYRENWNSPVVVTTSVRFFDGLFSNRPRDLRRLHSLAHSVVILDEVQTLPRGVVLPILTMLRDLSEEWGTTFVFSTATQPAFERGGRSGDGRLTPGSVREIAPKSLGLARRLKRVEASWPASDAPRISWSSLAAELASEPQVLCIVNTTRHARRLFDLLRSQADVETCWHLSARMCPLHRRRVLEGIYQALRDGRACRLVSTQVVEAGVDLDFPHVYRAMGPLDSVVQAAGRCDREGILSARRGAPGGRLTVFDPDLEGDAEGPPGVYREATSVTRRIAGGGPIGVDDHGAMSRYFEELYAVGRQGLDADDIEGLRKRLDFPEVARRFRLIPDDTMTVVVEWTEDVRRALRAIAAAREFLPVHSRLLQRASISLHVREFEEVKRTGAVYELIDGVGLWVVTQQAYRDDVGFVGRIDLPLIA